MNTNSKLNCMEITDRICRRQRKFAKDSLTFAMNDTRCFAIDGKYQDSFDFECIIAKAMTTNIVDGNLVEIPGNVYFGKSGGRKFEIKDWESLSHLFEPHKIVIRNKKTGQILHIFSLDGERITYATLEVKGRFYDCARIYYKEENLAISESVDKAAPPELDFYNTPKTYDILLSLAGRIAKENAFIDAIKRQNYLNVILCLVFKQSKEYTQDKDGKDVVQYAAEYANPEIKKLIHKYYIDN